MPPVLEIAAFIIPPLFANRNCISRYPSGNAFEEVLIARFWQIL
jgi:hypothetical protein